MTEQDKIRVTFTPECRALMDQIRLSPELVGAAIHQRHQELRDHRGTRLIACHWLSADRLILVDGEITRTPSGAIDVVTVQVVLGLRSTLPAGTLTRQMDAEYVLAVVAESFGIPLACDPDEPLSTLYSGPGRKEQVVVHSGCIPPPFWLLGSFDEEESHCEYVWAFRPDRYQTWLEGAM